MHLEEKSGLVVLHGINPKMLIPKTPNQYSHCIAFEAHRVVVLRDIEMRDLHDEAENPICGTVLGG